MHSIREIDVGVTRGSEHHFGAWSSPATRSVRCEVGRREVSLHLDEPAGELLAGDLSNQHLAEQVACHDDGIAVKELWAENRRGQRLDSGFADPLTARLTAALVHVERFVGDLIHRLPVHP